MPDFDAMRAHMVACQVRPANVSDPRLLAAMARIPRERFVPETLRAAAYVDDNIELAPGRWLMAPAAFARLAAGAPVRETDAVLDIGCATGYSTAVLGSMAAAAIGVESNAEFAARASDLLAELGVDNAVAVDRPLREGYPEQAPYDVIVLGGAVETVPDALFAQLAEGGRLAAIERRRGVSGASRAGKAARWIKTGGAVSRRPLFDAAAAPLPGFERSAGFVF